MFGIDRFYLGQGRDRPAQSSFTFGGLLIWWIIDIILIATDSWQAEEGQVR